MCLAANIVVSAEFVPGEMSLSQASETYGGDLCCLTTYEPACGAGCSVSGNYFDCKDAESGYYKCSTYGDGSCGDCYSWSSGGGAVTCG